MLDTQLLSTIAGAVGTGVVFACTVPSAKALGKRAATRKAAHSQESEKLYQDEDGKASESSEKQIVAFIPKLLGLIASLTGLLISVAYAVLLTSSFYHGDRIPFSWLTVSSWICISVQSVSIYTERRPVSRYSYGICASLSCFVLALSQVTAHGPGLFDHRQLARVLGILVGVQLACLAIAFFAFLSIQRRPAVFLNGKPVDGQFTSSAWSRLTFAWSAPMLAYARKNKGLDLDDLPKLSSYQRSRTMEAAYLAQQDGSRLWKSLARLFWRPFTKQVIFSIFLSFAQFGPQFSMFKLLGLLEQRSIGADVMSQAWLWVFALGAFMFSATFLESWLFFIVMADLGMPLRSLLSVLVFSKSTRRKDVKGTQSKQEEVALSEQVANAQQSKDSSQQADSPAAEHAGKVDGGDDSNSDEDDIVTKSRQATINLIGVDAKRVADLCSYMYLYPSTLIEFTISMVFLCNLIGWKALLAGMATFACTIPFNVFLSRRYSNAQHKLMSTRDSKLAVINEALQGIRQIKFSALEQRWQDRIGEKREAELKTQWLCFVYDTGLVSLWIFGPVMLAAVCLCSYTLLYGNLTPSVAFTTTAILAEIEFTLAIVPELTAEALDAWVAITRIEKYLNTPEIIPTSEPGQSIRFDNATVAWPADDQEEGDDRFTLKDLSFEIPMKELTVISGRTGSGKSLLLAAIIGEVDKIKGTIYTPKAPAFEERFDHKATPVNWIIDSAVAFVAQIPWIENASIKDNILFGLPYDQGRYRKVLEVCALEKDLDILPDGDLTDIGANGVNLSGGQRWRVSFARAMYSRAGILVLDDIFSAVDAHVGKQLFEDALTGVLGEGRTRILVTHHVGLCLSRTKYSIHLIDGVVSSAGLVEDLQKRGDMAQILKEEATAIADDSDTDDEDNGPSNPEVNGNGEHLAKVISRRSVRSAQIDNGEVDTKGRANPKKFIEDEVRETGGIKLGVYWHYILAGGGALIWIPLMSAYMSASGLGLMRSYWITLWTRSYSTESIGQFDMRYHTLLQTPLLNSSDDSHLTESSTSHSMWYWLGIYFGLSLVAWVMGTLKLFMQFVASIRASRKMFNEMNYAILRAPLRWLDTVPVGRILNRFSSDFNTFDSRLGGNMGYFFYQGLEMTAITLAGVIASWAMIPFAAILFGLCLYIMRQYLGGARECKRLESNAKSPIFTDFGAVLSGVATLRAFDKTATYINRMYDRIDTHGTSYYHVWIFNRWMGLRLTATGTVFSVLIAILVVATRRIDAALAGFALSFSLRYTTAITWTMRGYANVEMDLNSAERIIEYSEIKTESQEGNTPPAAWPTSGRLEVDNLIAAYAPDLPAVLKGLTFQVETGQRIGVVGRTGAGKSSLTLALFRFIQQREGTVYVDGLDVSKIKLHDLRSRLAIIPQDPVLFSGTVRSNLDPFDQHSDEELRTALHRVHLVEETGTTSRASLVASSSNGNNSPTSTGQDSGTRAQRTLAENSSIDASPAGSDQPAAIADNKNIFRSLSSKISEGGLNLSQGQRQLLCLARAIVSRPKVMVLDEATSAVDMATDELIQRSIREEFAGSTLLVIAHRLSTIADFDKVLVMSDGRAVEFDTPANLIKLKDGIFRSMVENSGEQERLMQIIASTAPA